MRYNPKHKERKEKVKERTKKEPRKKNPLTIPLKKEPRKNQERKGKRKERKPPIFPQKIALKTCLKGRENVEEKRKRGRPFGTFKYDSLEELETGIDNYFNDCDLKGKPYTLTGLALALNIDTKTLSNYGRVDYADANYFPAINRARQKCLDYAENRLYDKDGIQGAKFYLSNNSERMGGLKYAERQEVSVEAAPITFVDNLTD